MPPRCGGSCLLSPSQIPSTWSWLHEATPYSHLLKAVLSSTLHCNPADPGRRCELVTLLSNAGACGRVGRGAPACPQDVGPLLSDAVPGRGGPGGVTVPQYAYLAGRYGLSYDDRWAHYGTAVGITACIGFAAALALHGLREPWSHLALRAAAKSPAVGAA